MNVASFALALVVFMLAPAAGAKQARQVARPANVDERQDHADLMNYTGWYMEEAILASKNMQPTCFDCDPAQMDAPSRQCRDMYTDLYSKPTLDFRFVFGYMDDKNAEDVAAREAAVERLMRPCAQWLQGACGFTYESDDDDEVLVKKMRGPDGQEKTIRLTITSSAVSTNLAKNRGPLAGVQAAQTERARHVFESGLNDSDMLIYVGHGRDGGGPSFGPPRLKANGEVDFDWYNRNPASRNSMLAKLRGATNPPKLMGIFACYSEKYFVDQIRRAQPRTGVVGSTGLTLFEALYAQSFGMLDAVLAMRCERQFFSAVHSVREVKFDPNLSIPPVVQAPPVIRGVWDRPPRSTAVPAPQPASAPALEAYEEPPPPTGETVRPQWAPVLLTPSITPEGSGVRSQPRSTTPADANR